MPMARWFVDRLPQRGIPSVSLRRLLPEAQFVGGADWEVSGCTDDHRRLDPGQVFVAVREAWPGYDGHVYVREALERGAAGVVVERPCPEAGRLQVVVADAMAAHAKICQALAGDPSRQLQTLGVTGGFGRTIAALMVRSILVAAGQRIGLIGALGFCDGTTTRALGAGVVRRGGHTLTGVRAGQGPGAAGPLGIGGDHPHQPGSFAPGAASLAALMAELVERGCKGSVIEVSSEALWNRGVEGVTFDAAVVTDVSAPHGLTPEVLIARRRAKAKLFRQVVPGGVTVVNAVDPHAEILGGVNLNARRVGFALEPRSMLGSDRSALVDVSARVVRLDGAGTHLRLQGFGREAAVHLPLVGPRVATCALAAAALAWALEIDLDAVINGLEAVQSVAGHLEAVAEGQDFDVRIDAAQTPSALVEALTAVRAVATGRVHCVLSAEGGGDRALRRQLAEIAENAADRVIVTLSNPRTEDPGQILDDLLAGFRRPGKVRVVPDRQLAIEAALTDARSGDVVLVAGKGRNTYQLFADRVIPFDDAAIARQWLRAHQLTPVQRSA
jgi:UDP-N-acetylmuramoyl-L-alanyl-D-glutamate--2,6-diaminopimelate ligase